MRQLTSMLCILLLASCGPHFATERPPVAVTQGSLDVIEVAETRSPPAVRVSAKGTVNARLPTPRGANEMPPGSAIETGPGDSVQVTLASGDTLILDGAAFFEVVRYGEGGVVLNLGLGWFFWDSRGREDRDGARFRVIAGADFIANSTFAAHVTAERTTIYLFDGSIAFRAPERASMRAGQIAVIEGGTVTISPMAADVAAQVRDRFATTAAQLRPVDLPPATITAGGLPSGAVAAAAVAALVVLKATHHH